MCGGPVSPAGGVHTDWYRSSQKKKRDEHDRNERIERAIGRLDALDLTRMRGPKTDAASQPSRSDHHSARPEEWITVDIKWDAVEHFKAVARGKPTPDTIFRRSSRRSRSCM
jgi:hypothetical protein